MISSSQYILTLETIVMLPDEKNLLMKSRRRWPNLDPTVRLARPNRGMSRMLIVAEATASRDITGEALVQEDLTWR